MQETLPDFFETGLVISVNKTTGMPSRYSFFSPPTNISFLEPPLLKDDEEPIYCPNIRLSYTPQLPAPFPKTFHIEGEFAIVVTEILLTGYTSRQQRQEFSHAADRRRRVKG